MNGTQSQSGGQPVRVCYCCAPSDEPAVRELDRHLAVLRAKRLIEVLDPSALPPGATQAAETARLIDQADIILFFLSADSLTTTCAAQREHALSRLGRGEVRLLPVLLRAVLWQESPFAPLVPLPRGGRPVASWRSRDEAWTEIAQELLTVVLALAAQGAAPARPPAQAPRVLIVHADADAERAERIADRLVRSGLRCSRHGFALSEPALADAEYCLLLWSRAAAQQVQATPRWEEALAQAIHQRRGFLVTARLEDPDAAASAPLRSRLRVDLFPELEPGVTQLLALWCEDRRVEQGTARPVASAPQSAAPAPELTEVFVTSATFGVTVPVQTALDHVAGVLLSRVVSDLKLPTSFDREGRVGVRFEYALAMGERPLAAELPLGAQGVHRHSVLWIETRMIPFAAAQPVRGRLSSATLRGGAAESLEAAQQHLSEVVARNGLGRDYPAR